MNRLKISQISRLLVCTGLFAAMVQSSAADDAATDDPRDARAMGYQAVDHGWTEPVIIRHARNGDALEFDRALRSGQTIDARDLAGNTPLYWTIYNGHLDLTQIILRKGGDVNAQNDAGETPLHWAARHCPIRIVEFLVANGADPTIADAHGNTPVLQAERLQRRDVTQRLKSRHGTD